MPAPGARPDLRGADHLKRAVLLALGLDAALAWAVVLGIHTFLQRIWLGLAHRGLEVGSLQQHWAQVEMVRRLHGVIWIATAVLFLVWLHRAWARLGPVGSPGRRFTPRTAVAACLIPVLNLAGGYRAVAGLWDPGDRHGAGGDARVPPVVGWWWSVFLVASALDPPPLRLVGGAEAPLALGWPTLRVVGAMLGEIGAAVLAIAVVWRAEVQLEEPREPLEWT